MSVFTFEDLFAEFLAVTEEAIGVFLVSNEGLPLSFKYRFDSEHPIVQALGDFDLSKNENLYAFTSTLTLLFLEKCSNMLDSSNLEQIHITTEKSNIIFMKCGSSMFLIVIFDSNFRGLNLIDINRLADKIIRVYGDDSDYIMDSESSKTLKEKLVQLEQNLRTSIHKDSNIAFTPAHKSQLNAKIFVMYPFSDFNSLGIAPIIEKISKEHPSLDFHYFHSSSYNSNNPLDFFLDNLEWCDVFLWIHTEKSRPIEYKLAQSLKKKILILSTSLATLPNYAKIKCCINWSNNTTHDYGEIINGLRNVILESDNENQPRPT